MRRSTNSGARQRKEFLQVFWGFGIAGLAIIGFGLWIVLEPLLMAFNDGTLDTPHSKTITVLHRRTNVVKRYDELRRTPREMLNASALATCAATLVVGGFFIRLALVSRKLQREGTSERAVNPSGV